MTGKNKAFPGLMEVLPGLKEQIKSSFLYKIGDLTNIFENISFKCDGSFSKRKKKKNLKGNKKKIIIIRGSPSSGDQCFLHLIFLLS